MDAHHRRKAYWRRNVLLTSALLGMWFVFSFGITYFARQLDFRFFGWPFGFWAAAQGALIVFVLVIALYAWVMDRLDQKYGVQETDH
jgi:putative solute:sodium symporter small subunit